MPVLFVGHGSPMNAIEENEFVKLGNLEHSRPGTFCAFCIGKQRYLYRHAQPAHSDFGAFRGLYVSFRSGSPELASSVKQAITSTSVGLDEKWGLDHGAWSVIRNIYPGADVPVIEMSLDYNLTPQKHYELAKELASFRNKGVLIIGSGNMVHNLRMIAWDRANKPEYGFDWALRANEILKNLILENNHRDLINYSGLGRDVQLAVPTPEHYLPLLYSLALKEENETVSFFNDKIVMGSLSMISLRIG